MTIAAAIMAPHTSFDEGAPRCAAGNDGGIDATTLSVIVDPSRSDVNASLDSTGLDVNCDGIAA
jgi:hypothetical protein